MFSVSLSVHKDGGRGLPPTGTGDRSWSCPVGTLNSTRPCGSPSPRQDQTRDTPPPDRTRGTPLHAERTRTGGTPPGQGQTKGYPLPLDRTRPVDIPQTFQTGQAFDSLRLWLYASCGHAGPSCTVVLALRQTFFKVRVWYNFIYFKLKHKTASH